MQPTDLGELRRGFAARSKLRVRTSQFGIPIACLAERNDPEGHIGPAADQGDKAMEERQADSDMAQPCVCRWCVGGKERAIASGASRHSGEQLVG